MVDGFAKTPLSRWERRDRLKSKRRLPCFQAFCDAVRVRGFMAGTPLGARIDASYQERTAFGNLTGDASPERTAPS
jgi:hypothetical protein